MAWPFAWLATVTRNGPLGWGLASLTFFILFLLLTFPFDPLQHRLLTEFNRTSGLEVRAADWSVGLPAAIEWRDLVLTGPASGTISVGTARAAIGVFQAILGQLVVEYAIQLPRVAQSEVGRASGSLTSAAWSLQGPLAVKGHLQQMDLATVLKPYVSRGTIQGDFMHRWDST
ncbi:MAG: type II secretion system protein GspN, partial [Nitrospirota bacterium]